MFLSLCLSVTLSLPLIIIVRTPLCTPSSSFVIPHLSFSPSLTTLPLLLHRFIFLSLQAARERETSQAQLKALSQQAEAARRELADVLGRLAQREEEIHRKDVQLSETQQRHLSLQQEIREVCG